MSKRILGEGSGTLSHSGEMWEKNRRQPWLIHPAPQVLCILRKPFEIRLGILCLMVIGANTTYTLHDEV